MKPKKKTTQTDKLLPHNYRIFSAFGSLLLTITLWFSLGCLIALNIWLYAKNSQAVHAVSDILAHPASAVPHLKLAEELWNNKQSENARRELTLANDIVAQSSPLRFNILGTSTDSLLTSWEKQEQDLRTEYAFWQSVVKQKPDYRDAYITLATLAFRLNLPDESKKYVEEALRLDPNVYIDPQLTSFVPKQ